MNSSIEIKRDLTYLDLDMGFLIETEPINSNHHQSLIDDIEIDRFDSFQSHNQYNNLSYYKPNNRSEIINQDLTQNEYSKTSIPQEKSNNSITCKKIYSNLIKPFKLLKKFKSKSNQKPLTNATKQQKQSNQTNYVIVSNQYSKNRDLIYDMYLGSSTYNNVSNYFNNYGDFIFYEV